MKFAKKKVKKCAAYMEKYFKMFKQEKSNVFHIPLKTTIMI